jgi:molybdopterin molybdotransferase
MLSVAEALDEVRRHAEALPPRRLRLSELLSLRLADDIVSRVDSPPFDKSMVDGFAISTNDRTAVLRITELVTAGAVPRRVVSPGTTIRVMTGAPIPAGADAVVKWEDCEQLDDATIRNPAAGVAPGSCVLKRGASFYAGQTVLAAGKRLGPIDIALLAEIGQAEAAAIPRPQVGILPTGDELVEADEACRPGQIRNSNGPMLVATVATAGAAPVDLGVARDSPEDLRTKISRGLGCDVLLVSGGVSAGVKDLVPGVLAELGVREVFHQVRVKPGKPLWFGVSPSRATGVSPVRSRSGRSPGTPPGETPVAYKIPPKLVFGLPGNPVSTLVCFRLFVQPALAALAGAGFAAPETRRALLSQKIAHRGGRPTYHPCRMVREDAGGEFASGGAIVVEPLAWRGSADVAALSRADGLAVLPEGEYELPAGAGVDVLLL